MNRSLFWIGSICFVAGCDPVVLVHQRVEIRVTRVTSNEPVANAAVDLAPAISARQMYPRDRTLTKAEWAKKHYWKPALTSEAGIAALELRQGIMHPPFRPRYPDFVSQKSFILVICEAACTEELEIAALEAGRRAQGDCVEVEVLLVSDPKRAK